MRPPDPRTRQRLCDWSRTLMTDLDRRPRSRSGHSLQQGWNQTPSSLKEPPALRQRSDLSAVKPHHAPVDRISSMPTAEHRRARAHPLRGRSSLV